MALNNTLRKVYNITYHIVNTILDDCQGKSIHMIIQTIVYTYDMLALLCFGVMSEKKLDAVALV